jgi:leucyl-tRNA synthetase
LCEELWERFGHEDSLAYAAWPVFDESKIKLDEVEILVQVLGKPKARIMMPADANPATMQELALANPEVQAAVDGKNIVKVIAVPGRLVNIVAK